MATTSRMLRALPITALLLVALSTDRDSRAGAPTATASATSAATSSPSIALALARARKEVERQVSYDSTYRVLTFKDELDTGARVYPGGDLDPRYGVCTDVVVRGMRAAGVDLQQKVHEDALAHPKAYPSIGTPDANIDHRRVTPVMSYFDRAAKSLPKGTTDAADRATWKAGDVVVWTFGVCPACHPEHIGWVSDRIGPRGLPLVIHNLGPHPTEDDDLDAWPILRHFRVLE